MKVVLLALLVAGAAFPSPPHEVALTRGQDIAWGEHPFIKGGMLAVQSGDPSKGPSVLLMKFPKGLTIPPHIHTSDETVTIVSGSGVFGGGELVDLKKGTELASGSYISIPGKSPHWAVVKDELIMTVSLNLPADFHLCGDKK